MNTNSHRWAVLLVPLLWIQAALAQPDVKVLPEIQGVAFLQPADKEQPKQPAKDKDQKAPEKKLTDPPATDLFTQTPAPLRDALGYNPHMMGDFYGTFSRVNVNVPATQTVTRVTTIANPAGGGPPRIFTNTSTTPVTIPQSVLVAVPGYGAFKVAENASPMPVDRVFFTYNFFNDIRGQAPNDPTTITQRVVRQNQTGNVATTTFIPAAPVPFVNLNREVFGFEKTFLGGAASVEVRLPLYQQPSDLDTFRAQNMGDLTIISKYAFYLNRQTGDVLSGGLALTVPTGPSIQTFDGPLHSTLLQPWFGYIWNFDRLYVHAFHSAVLPSDSRDVTMLFNDVGLGYFLYRGEPNRALRFIVPTVEAHVTTPLSNRGANELITVPDLAVMTGGVHIGLFRNSTLSLGVGSPVSGPRIYGMEAFMQFNRRF